MKLGWLHDDVGLVGGAELSSDALLAHAPDGVRIVHCGPRVRPPTGLDAYIITNCLTYSARWIEELSLRPVIKVVRDDWHTGSIVLRRWILDHAQMLIFGSPLHQQWFCWPADAPTVCVPPPVDVEAFRAAARPAGERAGNIFVGRVDWNKGAHRAIDWALRNGETLDVYGQQYVKFGGLPEAIRFHGPLDYGAMPEVMGRAKRFVFMPTCAESYSRTTVEAWAAGCELVVEGRIGALWWLEHQPEDVGRGVEMFWDVVLGEIG